MSRLPDPGGDDGQWGTILNNFLLAAHTNTGDLKPGIVTEQNLDAAAQVKLNGAGGTTDLSVTQTGSNVTIASSSGADATVPAADTTNAGVMAAADKTKLNGIATGATANATDAQLRDRTTHTGVQAISTVTGLQTSLDGKTSVASGGLETVSTQSATGATTLSLTNGNVFDVTLTGATTFTFSGATSGKACSFTLYLHQDSTGSRTVTWPASVKWSGPAPTLTTAANAVDIFVFESLNGGTTWYGSLVGLNFA